MRNSTVWIKRAAATALGTVFIVGVVLSAGCAVGPKYNRPAYATPPAFRGADDSAVVSVAQKSIADEVDAQLKEQMPVSYTHLPRNRRNIPLPIGLFQLRTDSFSISFVYRRNFMNPID